MKKPDVPLRDSGQLQRFVGRPPTGNLRAHAKRDPWVWHERCALMLECRWTGWHDIAWLERTGDPPEGATPSARVRWLKTQLGAADGRLLLTTAVLDGLHLYVRRMRPSNG